MSYMIRKAEKGDLPRIYEIYETARQFMRENGNHAQWGAGDRPEELLEDVPLLIPHTLQHDIVQSSGGWSDGICFYRRRGSCLSEN